MDLKTVAEDIKFFYITLPVDRNKPGVPEIPEMELQELKKNNVKTIFIVSSETVHLDSYIYIVKQYKNAGFKVESIYMDNLNYDQFLYVRVAIKEIHTAYTSGNSMILSYGKSFTGVLFACFLVLLGYPVDYAIERVRKISPELLGESRERFFIFEFQKYLESNQQTAIHGEIFTPFKTRPKVRIYYKNKQPMASPVIWKAEPTPDMKQKEIPPALQPDAVTETSFTDIQMRKEEPVQSVPDDPTEELQPVETDSVQPQIETPAPPETPEVEPLPPAMDVKKTGHIEKETVKDEAPEVPRAETGPVEKTPKEAETVESQDVPKEISPGAEEKAEVITGEKVIPDDGKKRGLFSSLRFKLIFIISIIIGISLSGMIFLASHFFKQYNELQVYQSNHKISEVIALKVNTDFSTIIEKAKIISNSFLQPGGFNPAIHFSNENDILFIGIASSATRNAPLTFYRKAANAQLLANVQLANKDIDRTTTLNSKTFAGSFNGETIVHNVSQGLNSPAIGLSLPFSRAVDRSVESILVIYFKLDSLLEAFKTQGITTAFMINDKGDIIAHPDSTIVLSGGNYQSLPIVKMMLKSKIDNGQTRFKDENNTYQLGSFKKIRVGGCGVIATVQEEKAFQEVYNIRRRNIYLMMIVLTMAILVVFFFGKTITNPIIRLVNATKRIKEGEYDVDIKAASKDEIGELTNSFVEMGHGLAEREKMKDAFGKFVNKEIAEQVLKGEIRLGGERKEVAILFSDIRSFTSISEKLEPEQIVEFLNEYMTRMVGCIDETGGVVDKFIGDAIMAEWGVPVSKGNDTENAVNAALLMRKAMLEFNIGRGTSDKPIIKFGCGINTGPAIAGQIGSENRMEYTVIGDAVNLASRIEALTRPFGSDILISQDAYELVKDIFAVEQMQQIKVKGKEEKQTVYGVLGKIGDPDTFSSMEELRKKLGIEILDRRKLERNDDSPEEGLKYELPEE